MAFDAGGDEFLSRPVVVDQLLAALAEYLPIEWRYLPTEIPQAQINEEGPQSSIFLPSEKNLIELLNLSQDGQIFKLCRQIDHLKNNNSSFIPFAEKIMQFAKAYEIEELEAFLVESINQSAETSNA